MIEWIVAPWTYAFMRWALVACVVLGMIHAYLGFHVVRRGVLFVDLAMAQSAALGAAIGTVVGLEHGTVGGYFISAAFSLGAAAFFALVRSRRVHQEAIVAVTYGLAMAATFVVLEHSPHGAEEVKHLLVGQVLTVAPGNIFMTAGLYAVAGLVLARFHPRILAATEQGNHDVLAELVFYGVFALVVTSSVHLVGVLLVFALLVMPTIAAMLLTEGSARALVLGWLLA
ncbi:metal ABC transporter permease, partial [bacterium]|nr:metal ABC transporter permease [bacterium]